MKQNVDVLQQRIKQLEVENNLLKKQACNKQHYTTGNSECMHNLKTEHGIDQYGIDQYGIVD